MLNSIGNKMVINDQTYFETEVYYETYYLYNKIFKIPLNDFKLDSSLSRSLSSLPYRTVRGETFSFCIFLSVSSFLRSLKFSKILFSGRKEGRKEGADCASDPA